MSQVEQTGPIPILVVGERARDVVAVLSAGLPTLGQGSRFSCAGFEAPAQAADASAGAEQLILIAVGSNSEEILADPVWQRWAHPGSTIGRILITDATTSAAGSDDPSEGIDLVWAAESNLHRLDVAQMNALPILVEMVARLLDAEHAETTLRARLATEQACEPLSSCLEPGKLYSMALDLLLERLGRTRGIAAFTPSPAPQHSCVAARGFDEETHGKLCHHLIEEKAAHAGLGQGEVSVVPWGPLHHVLGRVGIESPGALLSVPLRGDELEVGHVWILGEGQRFGEAELETARTIARRAGAALETAERYHHAKERAFIDDVTGVYNARYLLATADNEIQRAARYGNPLSVLFLDLDRFKTVNDRYGHLVGSDTLRALSKLLAECVRQVDTLARYGGDEFTILLVDTPHETAMMIGERIRRRVEEHLFEAGAEGSLQLTISIGVATCPSHGEEREVLLDAADKAMYRAKSEGRNRVCSAAELPSGDTSSA